VEEPGRRGRNAHTPRDPIESEGGTRRERGAQRRRKQPVVSSGVLSVVARARHLELVSHVQHLPHDWARKVRSFVTPLETAELPLGARGVAPNFADAKSRDLCRNNARVNGDGDDRLSRG